MDPLHVDTSGQPSREDAPRRIAHRTSGLGHGAITRLMSPSDLGQVAKPFVFLDIFNFDSVMLKTMAAGGGMQLHPHSGLATVTVFTEGRMHFNDPANGSGTISPGGVEWMRASGGVWHGKDMSPIDGVARVRGFQLWVAMPAALENAEPESRYIEAGEMRQSGPAWVIVGAHEGVHSPVPAPPGTNYLQVTLQPYQRWTYQPPAGHSVGWMAVDSGHLQAGEAVYTGEMVVFEQGEVPIAVHAGSKGATFVLGSAVPHPHELHLGWYSVHTSAEALAQGERRIAELGQRLRIDSDLRRSN